MRVNIYAEEMTDRVEMISKTIDGFVFTAVRFYLELPVTVGGAGKHDSVEGPTVYAPLNGKPAQVAGPFIHRPGDDDSAAVTFWGKRDLRPLLRKALALLDNHYGTAFCDQCPHALVLHNPDGSCGCGIDCARDRANAAAKEGG